jgi:hypothetical protein
MAKVSRSMLKSIVKECLVELLAEGLSGGDTESLNESLSLRDTIPSKSETFSSSKVANPRFEEKTKQIISQATKDPIMASILEDTAQTTLQEQNGADRPNQFTAKPTDTYSQIANESDPMSMFEGASENWATLAFSDN